VNGQRIVTTTWAATVLFAVAVVLGVTWPATELVAIWVSVVLFFVGSFVALYAFGKGIVRSTRGDDVSVANLFFLQGSAPRNVRRHFLAILVASLAVVGLSILNLTIAPYAWLELMVSVGMPALWAARHGTFPTRTSPAQGANEPSIPEPTDR
jgi:hypothetical protein